ncbi:MAG TPA: elongation factor G [Candidatus Kapabacteria bacterium]|jgi:elongation factor G|nr:elongation factor G [Ignavibacteria bacterium]HRE57426.1 elongation factor G [Candidatus Kapabacteria bacterium]HRK58085.1 elongation factor G [Candidatus Kapabacteria bacterium]
MSRSVEIRDIRNVGIMAHIDAGKTTTTERMLFYSGFVHKMGNVDEGNTVTDYMQQERERGITIVSAAITFFWDNHQINLIDTPGHVDFTAEVQRSLRVLDGAVAVFCGVAGVQPQSETVWRQADMYKVPRIAYVNKMDRVGADFDKAVQSIVDKLKAKAVPIQIPIGASDSFEGIIDVIEKKAYYFDDEESKSGVITSEIPQEYRNEVEMRYSSLLETLADFDDEIMVKYLNGEYISVETIQKTIRAATIQNSFIPVLCGSSFKNKGVQPLLDAVVHYLPSPLDRGETQGFISQASQEIEYRKPNEDEPFSGLVFKVITDPFVGQLSFLRVYSGKVNVGERVHNSTVGKNERIGKLLRIAANKREEVTQVFAGDIIAVPAMKFSRTGDTLCAVEHPILYEKIDFAEPVINQSIEVKTSSDQDKLVEALTKLSEEDPTFRFFNDAESGQTIISGVGELHLEIIVDRIKREFNVQTKVGRPQVSYRESISSEVIQEGIFERQSANGKGQYAKVVLQLSPNERGTGNTAEISSEMSQIPKQYFDVIIQSCLESLSVGPVAGYPMTDVHVNVIGGDFIEESANEIAYKIAASIATRDGCRKAHPMMLEPVFSVEVVSPEEHIGDVIADLSSRRGRIEGIQQHQSTQAVEAIVPLAQMFGYVTTLRSITQGRGSYSMKFYGYDIKV